MSKVKRITVSNLKAVSELTADFNGCTAIITGGNNKGKTSFLDKNSLQEIETWANQNDLQLLIERPDFEGGEIEYHILEK